jgi:hypothetical protein
MVLSGGSGTFKRWSLVGGIEVTGGVALRGDGWIHSLMGFKRWSLVGGAKVIGGVALRGD